MGVTGGRPKTWLQSHGGATVENSMLAPWANQVKCTVNVLIDGAVVILLSELQMDTSDIDLAIRIFNLWPSILFAPKYIPTILFFWSMLLAIISRNVNAVLYSIALSPYLLYYIAQ